MDDPRALSLRDFAERPREALMWPPCARDVARLAAAARAVAGAPRARVLDAGAGSGLLARLLADEGLDVTAVDAVDANAPPPGVGRFFAVERRDVASLPLDAHDLAVVSWMEAGRDYRAAVAARARAVVVAHDPAGGCGGRGGTGFAEHGLAVAASWRTPSHEDAAHALRTRGRGPGGAGLPRPGGPGNVVEVWADDSLRGVVAAAVEEAMGTRRLPWEDELEAVGLAQF